MYPAPPTLDLDLAFQALAHATRRSVIAQLTRGEASVAELAAAHALAQPTFLRHVRVLEEAGLVATRKVGRVRTCRLRAERLEVLESWLQQHQRLWSARLGRLAQLVDDPPPHPETPDDP